MKTTILLPLLVLISLESNAQWTTNSNGMYYYSSGKKVGIGTTYPNSKLHINASNG